MILDRLTERARRALSSLPQKKKITSGMVLDAIKKVDGMGNYIYANVPNIVISINKTVSLDKLLKESYYQAIKFDHPYVGTEHLLLGLLKITGSKDLVRVRTEMIKLNIFPNAVRKMETSKKTPVLDGFSVNLNQKALKNLDDVLVHRIEYDALVSALLQKSSKNVLLVGEPGVGKRTLIELLARNITTLEIPPVLAGYQVIDFDLVAFLTNVFNKGNVDLGLSTLAEELKSLGRVILSVKNFQNLFFSTAAGMTLPVFYSMFRSILDETGAKLVATMNSSLYEKIVLENDHIVEDFTIVEVGEPSEKDTLRILENTALRLSEFHNMDIPLDSIRHVYKKARTAFSDNRFPQKGIELLDHACSYLVLKKSRIPNSYKKLVDRSFTLLADLDHRVEEGEYDSALKMRNDLRGLENKLVSKEANLFSKEHLVLKADDINAALTVFGDDKKQDADKTGLGRLTALADNIKRLVIGQDEAVDLVVRSLLRSKLGLRTRKRSLGNFLFLGPTGVGKTELAKVLASEFYGEKSLIRLDMSDFSEKHNVARLIGAPPGYVGYGEGGELTSKISQRPDSVVLFDEIEKAHPDVLNILLQIMEEGELTDARGNTFDFSQAVIILTSNLGTEILHANDIGFGDKRINDKSAEGRLKVNLKKILKPELINRFDEVIIFKRLSRDDQFKVLEVLLSDIFENIKSSKVLFEITDAAKEMLVNKGYSEEYGARALRRTVEKDLLDKLAEYMLKHKARPLSIIGDVKSDEIVIEDSSLTPQNPLPRKRGRPRKQA